jgi:hypothetical protein
VIKQGSKIWQKSTTKWLIVTLGWAWEEDNINHKFEAPQHYSGHVMMVIIIRGSLKFGDLLVSCEKTGVRKNPSGYSKLTL